MTEHAHALLQIQDLTVALPAGMDRSYAVKRMSLNVNEGEILCVVGESGSGKSVTASAVIGLLPKGVLSVSGGSIRFEDHDLLQATPEFMRELRGARIGLIFQEPMTALNPLMRVGDQVAEVMEVHGIGDRQERVSRTVKLLKDVGLPEPDVLRHAFPFRLSGGQRQRVMIAMALALEPRVLIADEPTTALDVTTQAQILALIKDIQRRQNMGVLFITHDFGVVADIADRVAVMQHGEVVEVGPADQVLNTPAHPYTRQLIDAVPRLRSFDRIIGHDGEPALLHVKNLTKVFPSRGRLFRKGRSVVAVDQVSFSIRQGETLGLVGESGSGKSTTGRCIARLLDADEGEIRLGTTDLAKAPKQALLPLRKDVQMIFQDPYASLNPRRKIGRIVMEGPLAHGVSREAAEQRMRSVLETVGLQPAAADRYPHEFSGGQRQRIGIARALALQPKLLIADEPVSALDVSIQSQVLELLDTIRQQFQLAMLFITHDLRVAAQICDYIAVMQRGRIVEMGPTAEIFGKPQHAYTRKLIHAVPGKHFKPWHREVRAGG